MISTNKVLQQDTINTVSTDLTIHDLMKALHSLHAIEVTRKGNEGAAAEPNKTSWLAQSSHPSNREGVPNNMINIILTITTRSGEMRFEYSQYIGKDYDRFSLIVIVQHL